MPRCPALLPACGELPVLRLRRSAPARGELPVPRYARSTPGPQGTNYPCRAVPRCTGTRGTVCAALRPLCAALRGRRQNRFLRPRARQG